MSASPEPAKEGAIKPQPITEEKTASPDATATPNEKPVAQTSPPMEVRGDLVGALIQIKSEKAATPSKKAKTVRSGDQVKAVEKVMDGVQQAPEVVAEAESSLSSWYALSVC
jgi:hypothetical protein